MNYYPPVGYSFVVALFAPGGGAAASLLASSAADHNFKEVSGLNSDITVTPQTEGGVLDYQHPLPSVAKHGNVTLKRGLLLDSPLVNWVKETLEDYKIQPKDMIITLLGPYGAPIAAWCVENAYPIKWDVGGFNSMANEIVIETIELACRKHRRLAI